MDFCDCKWYNYIQLRWAGENPEAEEKHIVFILPAALFTKCIPVFARLNRAAPLSAPAAAAFWLTAGCHAASHKRACDTELTEV